VPVVLSTLHWDVIGHSATSGSTISAIVRRSRSFAVANNSRGSSRSALMAHTREVALPELDDERDLHLINLLSESHSRADDKGKHHFYAGGLRLSLVPDRRS
jgi:hypothetical protein